MDVPEQTVTFPLILAGVAGVASTVTDKVWAPEVEQLLEAVNVMVPLDPAVALIVFVILVPLQPPGKVHA